MYYDYPENDEAYTRLTQYMFGQSNFPRFAVAFAMVLFGIV